MTNEEAYRCVSHPLPVARKSNLRSIQMLKTVWDKVCMKIAWLLPKRIVMWASVRLCAHATQGQWGNECPDAVNIMTALKRWPI